MTRIKPGEVWLDTDGKPIQAHGGGVLSYKDVYYWYGENKDAPNTPDGNGCLLDRVDVVGVSCYSSRDLVNWKNEGLALPAVTDDPDHELYPSKVVERPKVIFNSRTKQFVMWMHIDTRDYRYACTGRAISNSPVGPFQYLGSIPPAGFDSRDMTVFQDLDGSAYLYFSSERNKIMRIVKLDEDYLNPTGAVAEAFAGASRESPAVFRNGDRYFFIGSGCTGWLPNTAEYAVSHSPMGPWEVKGNPLMGPGSETTFGGQNTFVIPIQEHPDQFILMLDRWNPGNLRDSRYVWLPMQVTGDTISVEWHDSWDPSEFAPSP